MWNNADLPFEAALKFGLRYVLNGLIENGVAELNISFAFPLFMAQCLCGVHSCSTGSGNVPGQQRHRR